MHRGLVAPPRTPAAFDTCLKRLRKANSLGYWVRSENGELAGVINVSEIVRGSFQSAYLGYYAFSPHDGHGYMARALAAVVRDAFVRHHLHRLGANIQPGNQASRRLIRRLGFKREGFSPKCLKVGGRWRDRERWALTVERWRSAVTAG